MKQARTIADNSSIARDFIEKGYSDTCPVIDMHGHYGEFYGLHLPCAAPEEMARMLKRSGTMKIICSHHEALFGDCEQGNKYMQAVINNQPELFSGYWAVNPNQPKALDNAVEFFEESNGFVGFKILPDYHGYPVRSETYSQIFEYADAKQVPVLIHTWGGSNYNGPEELEKLSERYTQAPLILGHSCYGDWEKACRLGKCRPNVFLELTAVYAAHDYSTFPAGNGTLSELKPVLHVNGIIEYLCRYAGSEKIFYGTDMPWYSPHFAIGSVIFADISDDDRRNILYRNACRLLEQHSENPFIASRI